MLCALNTCSAATYTVSPNGHDTGPGTAASPFRTIDEAARVAGPGDRVVVKAGIYRETISLRRSGTESAPITFKAEPAGSVIVTGADEVTGWQRVSGSAPIYQVPWGHVFAIDMKQ